MEKLTGNKPLCFRAIMIVGLALVLNACGDDPSFLEQKAKFADSDKGGSSDDSGTKGKDSSDGNYSDDLKDGDGDAFLPGGENGDWMPDWVDGQEESDGSSVPTFNIPDANEDDLDALRKCMSKWGKLPFDKTITNFRKIYASVTVGGYGNAINDKQTTADPELVLIYAGVNVGGAPTWNLQNKNGYYCMVANVNVDTDFTINLACDARLADSKINVNVGSNQSDSTSDVGVHVNSNVTVNSVEADGSSCN
jgi:hypothetical protein